MDFKPEDISEPFKILLVDDKQPNLLALEALLAEKNRVFYWAGSGEEALGLAYRHEFALILLDVQMPDMDGFELANILKSSNRTKYVPIIFVTAYRFDEGDILQGYTEGAVDYLFKPLNPQITQSKVKTLLDLYAQRKHIEKMNLELDEKNKMLKSSNIALEELANIVSHDLKEPLRTISSFLELLHKRNKDKLDDSSLEFINLCRGSAARLDKLIKSLRAYASVGYRDVDRQLVNLNEVVGNVEDLLKTKIMEKKAEIIIKNELPTVLVNEIQYNQLFQNLIDNALKYQPENNLPVIEISSKAYGDGFWNISIRDNGIGVSEQFREKVFDLFQKFHPSGEYEGTGVGLAICKRIVEKNGGSINISSEEGVGTVFEFSVPKVEGP